MHEWVQVHRKKQPLPKLKPTVASRSSQGLALLTPEGRPKFYHRSACLPACLPLRFLVQLRTCK